MPFAATWRDLDIIILSEINQRKTNIIYHSSMWNIKKNDTNEIMYKQEIDPQT